MFRMGSISPLSSESTKILYGFIHKGTCSISHIFWNTSNNWNAISSWRRSSPHFTMQESNFQVERWPYGDVSRIRVSFSWKIKYFEMSLGCLL